jgi:hypothetical protein
VIPPEMWMILGNAAFDDEFYAALHEALNQ